MDVVSYSAEWVISSVVLAAGVTGMVTLHNLVLDKNHVADRVVDTKQVVSSPLSGDYNKENGGERPYNLTAAEVASDILSITSQYPYDKMEIKIQVWEGQKNNFYILNDLKTGNNDGNNAYNRIRDYRDVSFLFDDFSLRENPQTGPLEYKNAQLYSNFTYRKRLEYEPENADNQSGDRKVIGVVYDIPQKD